MNINQAKPEQGIKTPISGQLQKGPIELSQDLIPPQVSYGEEASMLNSTQQGRTARENSSKEEAAMPDAAESL